jgi:hypothetical protein
VRLRGWRLRLLRPLFCGFFGLCHVSELDVRGRKVDQRDLQAERAPAVCAGEFHRFGVELDRTLVLPGDERDVTEVDQRRRRARPVVRGALKFQDALMEFTRVDEVAVGDREDAEHVECFGDHGGVAGSLSEGQRTLGRRPRGRIVAAAVLQEAESSFRSAPQADIRRWLLERRLQRLAVVVLRSRAKHASCSRQQPELCLGVAQGLRVGECGPYLRGLGDEDGLCLRTVPVT